MKPQINNGVLLIPDGATFISQDIKEQIEGYSPAEFNECVVSVQIPETIVEIEDHAFFGCKNLQEIHFAKKGLKKIGDSAFYECCKLKSLNLPTSLTSIGKAAFSYCQSLEEITIPKSVKTLKEEVFRGCSSLKRCILHKSIKKIQDSAFYECTSLDEIELPEKLETLGCYSFKGCTSLKQITIPGGIEELGRVFENCTCLESVIIESGVKCLEYSFINCIALTDVSIPEGVTQLGVSTFDNCRNLKKLSLPASLKDICDYSGCDNLQEIQISEENNEFSFKDGILISGKYLIMYLRHQIEQNNGIVNIPEGIKSIDKFAEFGDEVNEVIFPSTFKTACEACLKSLGSIFTNCTNLSKITICNNENFVSDEIQLLSIANLYDQEEDKCVDEVVLSLVAKNCPEVIKTPQRTTIIGENAFTNCHNLKELFLSEKIKKIDYSAFWGCDMLEMVHLPMLLKKIHDRTFERCSSLKRVYGPKHLEEIKLPTNCEYVVTDF